MEEHLAGKGIASRVQGRELANQLEDVSVAGKPVKQDAAGDRGVPGEWAASWQAYTDGRAEPLSARGLTGGCRAVS
jgi:hypothetical protein